MGNTSPGAQRIEMPPSSVSGELYGYLVRMALALNNLPVISVTSYAGGPNSKVTGGPGDIAINLASGQTARFWIKEQLSTNTGWVSVATAV